MLAQDANTGTDFAGSLVDRWSTIKYCIFLAGEAKNRKVSQGPEMMRTLQP